ncbi:M48 family metalloprotease [Agrobacterium sp. SHOUNA12C]|uniref:Peptidase M50 family protein n=1 Tax=Rhizobium rhizogenes NBRC 13257 TaxID=1220581 RepID=A0AA87Q1H1_RHIRH|nr:M48 family metallopeptidase [Rhizobium rhizogenes]MCJ9722952.1 M48 family metalloprotease [Agrobacterium sp. BETTINA12B]MCJ9758072.1 M48 family metalloprotease [Agrobacterium sp. SHOUNA12C]NTF58023.1 M48 family metalloprotease [Rhizobium rhizogenes]NTF64442.1 M48 family metalloprotease [Rhizobium rhizogenes]NTF77605.1 M48 family metalloprotease [Rhizobium rhizogenes]
MNVTQTSGGNGNRKIDFRASLVLVVWVLLVPIALAALGLWQAQRAAETLENAERSSAELSTTSAQVKEIAATNPNASLTFEGEGGPIYLSALVAVSQIKDALSQADEDLEISRIRRPLVWVTIGGAVLAFIGGAAGLITATISGLRARRSQRQLIKSFQRLGSILPFILAMVVIGFCIGVSAAILFEAISIGLWADLTTGSAKLFVAALALAIVAAYSAFMALRGLRDVFALFTPEPLDVSGRALGEAEAPELWRFARSLADRQNALLPDTIIVGLTEGFFVTESQVRLWPEDRLLTGRSFYLPAPYLDLLDRPEITTIIGHEFAHFSGEDTRYSQRFTPIYAGFWRALTALQRVDGGRFVLYPAVKLGFHAIQQFDHAVWHWSRLREFEADRMGGLLGTPADAASALIRTGVIAPAVTYVLGRAHAESDNDALHDLVAETTELVRTEGWADPIPLLEDRQSHPTDSHPPTIRRISALGVHLDEDILRRATRRPEQGVRSFVHELFPDWTGLCRRLSQDFIDDARKARALRREALEKVVADVADETVVYDNVKPMIWTMGIVAGIFGAFGLTVVVFSAQAGLGYDKFGQMMMAVVTGTCAAAAAIYAVFLHRRAARPLMVLNPDGLVSLRLDRPIAWTEIAKYAVYASTRFSLRLWLHQDATVPKKDWSALYSKVDRRRSIVTLGAMGIRGMKPADFSALVGRYLYAAYARQELAAAASGSIQVATADENVDQ